MGLQKIAGGLLVFSLLSAGGGYFLRGSYPITPSEELEQVYPVTVSPIAAVFSYTDRTEEYSSSFLQGEIIEGTPLSRKCSGTSIITTVQVSQVFSGELEAGKMIQVIEPYSLAGEMESTYSGYLPMMMNQEYLLNLSRLSGNLYAIRANELGCYPAAAFSTIELSEDMTLGADRQYETVLVLSENYASEVLSASETDGYRQARKDSMQRAESYLGTDAG